MNPDFLGALTFALEHFGVGVCAVVGAVAALYVGLQPWGLPHPWPLVAGMGTILGVRLAAIRWNWALPVFDPAPPAPAAAVGPPGTPPGSSRTMKTALVWALGLLGPGGLAGLAAEATPRAGHGPRTGQAGRGCRLQDPQSCRGRRGPGPRGFSRSQAGRHPPGTGADRGSVPSGPEL